KKQVPSRVHFSFDTSNYFQERTFTHPTLEVVSPNDVQKIAERLLLNKYTPASVIINDNMDILHFRGNTGKFLEPASGAASLNLMRMAREGLMVELRSLIKKARHQGSSAKKEGLTVTQNGNPLDIAIEVVPLTVPMEKQRFYLVLFQESALTETRPGLNKAQRRNLSRQNETIQKELAATKDYLQSLIEEKEATNEELKSANEEILSSNEELQSTNEELETAKEELQSTNEELTTVNEELQNRHAELSVLNSDLENLLGSLDIPVLMVDGSLRIHRFNNGAEKAFNVSSVDVGRPIREIRAALEIESLEKVILKVADSMQVQELELRNSDGRWQSLRVRPYRTIDNKIDGAVITLIDIHDLKMSYERISAINAYAKAIVETIREPLLVLDENLRVLSANRSFFEDFQEKAEDTLGRQIFELGNGQWNNPHLRSLLAKVQAEGSSLLEIEIEHEFPRIGRRIMNLNARNFELPEKQNRLVLVAIADITERKRLERANVEISDQEQRRIGEDLHDGLGQHLTGMALLAKTLEKRLRNAGLEEAEKAQAIVENIQQTIQKVRHISYGLSPVQCEENGLADALEILCREVRETAGISCVFKAGRQIGLKDRDMATHLYRIAQEAIANAIKHGEAKRIEVELTEHGNNVSLLVQDNGKGLNSKGKTSGMGLSLMNYRAKLIGADLEIHRPKRSGTAVRCTVKNLSSS
ncbi:MAG TPA: PAS domain-containing protein, partial [bacterium]|nr:PAS domain-containing protein [bacterium]